MSSTAAVHPPESPALQDPHEQENDKESSSSSSSSEEESVFEVERILAVRQRRQRTEYLLKWKGYSHAENTWEPVANLKGSCDDLIEEFLKEKERKEQLKKMARSKATRAVSHRTDISSSSVAVDDKKKSSASSSSVDGKKETATQGKKKDSADNQKIKKTTTTTATKDSSNGQKHSTESLVTSSNKRALEEDHQHHSKLKKVLNGSSGSLLKQRTLEESFKVNAASASGRSNIENQPDSTNSSSQETEDSDVVFIEERQTPGKSQSTTVHKILGPAERNALIMKTKKLLSQDGSQTEEESAKYEKVPKPPASDYNNSSSNAIVLARSTRAESVASNVSESSQMSQLQVPKFSVVIGNKKKTPIDQTEAWSFILKRARGYPITVVNEVDDEPPPSDFTFIDYCLFHPDVPEFDRNFLVGCNCEFGCSFSRNAMEHCLCCDAHQGLHPYDSRGRILLSPRSVIYECNSNCLCPDACRNRVIQHGTQYRLQIFRTPNGRGWGVRALEPIPCGAFVATYTGEVITNQEAERRGKHYDKLGRTYLFDLDFFFSSSQGDPSDLYTVDGFNYGNISHFFNHSCRPNLDVYAALIEITDPRFHEVAFFAACDIKVGDELTFDYTGGDVHTRRVRSNHQSMSNVKSVPCLCGAMGCRGRIPL